MLAVRPEGSVLGVQGGLRSEWLALTSKRLAARHASQGMAQSFPRVITQRMSAA